MNKMKVLAFLCLIAVASINAQAQNKQTPSLKNKYQNIEVTRFDVKAGVEFPPGYLAELMKDIANQLHDTKKFKQVGAPGETLNVTGTPTLRLTGTVVEYKKGSRVKRYMLPGTGQTKIVAEIKFVDTATGAVVLERKVDGRVALGVLGGESQGATNGVAKEIAKVTKKEFF